jgi:putative membrane protein
MRKTMWNMPMYGEWGWLGMGIMMLLVWVPVLALVTWILTRLGRVVGNQAEGTPRSASARELLDRRYAAGEMGRDQYLQMASDLEHGRTAAANPR